MKKNLLAVTLLLFARLAGAQVREALIRADPSNYQRLMTALKPGDTLSLAAGTYPRLRITGLNGTPSQWITLTGPESGPPAVIVGKAGYNAVEIWNSSYVAIEDLRIDSRGIPGCFGIIAHGHQENLTHHIRIEGNTLVGQNGGQQTDGISTKTPTWGWVIRYNRILGAGAGIYLGESDGTQPFVNGVIENNLIKDTIGYNMEIKDQIFLPEIPGMPTGPTTTIIRNNVFIKNDQPSPDGDRPNLLVSAFPSTGAGSLNMYEIYGNYFVHNAREALFQGSGRISLHDNIFVDGPYTYPAVVLRKHNYPLKIAMVYNNTIYTSGKGIYFGSSAQMYDAVVGNLIFSGTPLSGAVMTQSDNIVDLVSNASKYVKAPSLNPGAMDFYPLPGQCKGRPLDLSIFHTDTDYSVDFNGVSKVRANGAVVYRGAYAGEGTNNGWQLQAGLKPPFPPVPAPSPEVVWVSPASSQTNSTIKVTVTGANFTTPATVFVAGAGVEVTGVKVASATEITAALKIAPAAAPGVRGLTVRTPAGNSNAVNFRITPRPEAPRRSKT